MANAGKTTYTQGHDKATLSSHASRTAEVQADYLLPHIEPHHHILDVGCGPGTITCGFAKYANKGKVTGVDFSATVIDHARAAAEANGVSGVLFQVAGAHDLPFPEAAFDVVHCHAVLVHLPDPEAAVREMRRVCKLGGFLAAREPDLDTCIIHPHHPALEKWRRLQAQMQRTEGAEPNAGRHLATWALNAGFARDKIQVSSDTLQYATKPEVRWWGEMYAKRLDGEAKERALRIGIASGADVNEVRDAYRWWSEQAGAIWAVMHIKLLAQKE